MSSVAGCDDLVIGVDIGGTKVAAGVVSPSGEILCHTRNPMVASNGAASGLSSVISAIETASAQAVIAAGAQSLIRGVGLCSPARLIQRQEWLSILPICLAGGIFRWRLRWRKSIGCGSR